EAAQEVLQKAVTAGILEAQPSGGRSKAVYLGFCQNLNKLPPKAACDRYCLECHRPGQGLQKCASCTRAFHKECQRTDPEKPIYKVPSNKGQKYRFPESKDEGVANEAPARNAPASNEVPAAQPSTSPLIDHNRNVELSRMVLSPTSFLKQENLEVDDDVFVVGSTEGARQRNPTTVKNELPAASVDTDASNELEYCTCCRLRQRAPLRHPPHRDKRELACLMGYSWKVHNSWLLEDVSMYMEENWLDHDRALVERILFHNKIVTLESIEKNIAAQKYTYLTHFLVDLIDLQHNIAVFFGCKDEHYMRTEYLVRDVTHDIKEILHCPDCFRNSNEKGSKLWFAKPCLQRHELVLAKTSGSPAWPAKVIAVSRSKPIKYDVRFFGSCHSRALIPERDITPIDPEVAFVIKPKATKAMWEAKREFECHLMLSKYPADLFGFNVDPKQTEELIQKALKHCAELPTPATSTRSSSPEAKKRKSAAPATEATAVVPKRVMPPRRCSLAAAHPEMAAVVEQQTISEIQKKLDKCQADLAKLTNSQAAVKRKRWCYICLNEATFDCCFAASYCSNECQRKHRKRHNQKCQANQ
ncbi:hypothetical protein KR018_005789, partial [Drosophila ironensis]